MRALDAQRKVGTAGERTAARRAHRVKMTQAEVLQGKYGLRMRMSRKLSATKAKHKQQWGSSKGESQPAGAGNAGESRDAQRRKAGAHGRKGGGEDKILDQMEGGYGEHRSVSQKASPEVVEVLGKPGAKHRKSMARAMREEDVNAKCMKGRIQPHWPRSPKASTGVLGALGKATMRRIEIAKLNEN
ncbi:hypothetical protein DFH08DRAFT_799506 [Mycena albidolilacea]|uniref:Uncharacterized protein n=1 Tax=Mycena albidolilacea TaxID=1033008 RepID=A0AAD7ALU5_9AGAR|nr:hypothetical protein DFH08DRAFT_799506 [Mycena albidolilacea]